MPDPYAYVREAKRHFETPRHPDFIQFLRWRINWPSFFYGAVVCGVPIFLIGYALEVL